MSDAQERADGREVLGQGSEPGRWAVWASARPRIAAALLLGVACVIGFGANELLAEPAHTVRDSSGRVVAGLLVETLDTNPAAMVVPLHNDSALPVTVSDVHPEGWRAYGSTVTLPPGAWVDVPIWLTLECGRMPDPTRRLLMRTVAARDVRLVRTPPRTVAMPEVPPALVDLRHRLCDEPGGRPLGADELRGSWLVEDARSYAGQVYVRFEPGGRFSLGMMRPARIDQEVMATGQARLEGDWLRLDVGGGWWCAAGDSIVWRVDMLPDGRLRIGHEAYYDDVCRVDEREVWLARRVR